MLIGIPFAISDKNPTILLMFFLFSSVFYIGGREFRLSLDNSVIKKTYVGITFWEFRNEDIFAEVVSSNISRWHDSISLFKRSNGIFLRNIPFREYDEEYMEDLITSLRITGVLREV